MTPQEKARELIALDLACRAGKMIQEEVGDDFRDVLIVLTSLQGMILAGFTESAERERAAETIRLGSLEFERATR